MDNISLARLLDETAALLEIDGADVFRVRSYRRAAEAVGVSGVPGRTEPVTEPGYPEPVSYPVRRCLQAILTEEWEHRLYAERDLDLLTSRSPG